MGVSLITPDRTKLIRFGGLKKCRYLWYLCWKHCGVQVDTGNSISLLFVSFIIQVQEMIRSEHLHLLKRRFEVTLHNEFM